MTQMVADVLVGVLEQIGVLRIFGLIGDTFNSLGHPVRHSRIEFDRPQPVCGFGGRNGHDCRRRTGHHRLGG